MKIQKRKFVLKGFDRIQETVMAMKLSEVSLPSGDIKIELNQEVEFGKCDSTWYGGVIATISCSNDVYTVVANGDVIAVLYDKTTGNDIAYVKDKSNSGAFNSEMCSYIENDAQLYEFSRDENPKYKLVFSYNNWFEIFLNKSKGKYTDQCYVSDSDNVFDVIAEAVDYMALPY